MLVKGQGYLLDQLDVWESLVGQPGNRGTARIFRAPYAMQVMRMCSHWWGNKVTSCGGVEVWRCGGVVSLQQGY